VKKDAGFLNDCITEGGGKERENPRRQGEAQLEIGPKTKTEEGNKWDHHMKKSGKGGRG